MSAIASVSDKNLAGCEAFLENFSWNDLPDEYHESYRLRFLALIDEVRRLRIRVDNLEAQL
jgi:hypothetical protein